MLASMKFSLLPLLCLLSGTVFAAELSVLNDHLRLDIPEATVTNELPAALMEASRHSAEALIRTGKGADTIFVIVKEKGYLAEDDFAQGVRKAMSNLNAEGDYFTIEQMGDNLVYALLREAPPAPSPTREYNYGFAEYRHPDGTVQKLSFVVRGGAAGDVQARRNNITAWLKTLKPGKGSLNTQARTEKQESYMKDCHVAVPVPEGFYAELNEGDGFHFVEYSRLSKRSAPVEMMSVQVGDHPQVDFKRLPASQQQTQKGSMAGQQVEWHLFEQDGLLFAECVLPLGPRGTKPTFSERTMPWKDAQEIIYLHITVITQEAAPRAELIRQAEQITLVSEREK